ncbi:MAG TPA: hypothetical protein VH062_36840 [Polyangiaceae bacterium]|jgi:hypothetical protein|nr:hypothetical protein [Polyangiaceae bacterium]
MGLKEVPERLLQSVGVRREDVRHDRVGETFSRELEPFAAIGGNDDLKTESPELECDALSSLRIVGDDDDLPVRTESVVSVDGDREMPLHDLDEALGVDRLSHHVVEAHGRGSCLVGDRDDTGERKDRDPTIREPSLKLRREDESVHVRKPEVLEHEIGRVPLEELERRSAIRGFDDGIAGALER